MIADPVGTTPKKSYATAARSKFAPSVQTTGIDCSSISSRSARVRSTTASHGVKKRLTEAELSHFTDLDFVHAVGLVATLEEGRPRADHRCGAILLLHRPKRARARRGGVRRPRPVIKGVESEVCSSTTSRAIARAGGITEFEAEVLGENNRHARGFRQERLRGPPLHRRGSSSTSRSRPARPRPPPWRAIARARHAAAEEHAGGARAASVAVVGASRRGPIGAPLLEEPAGGAAFRGRSTR